MYIVFVIPILTILLFYLIEFYFSKIKSKNLKTTTSTSIYNSVYEKKSLMTPSEKRFYKMFKNILGEDYIILPQIGLRTIINVKENKYYKYHNELNKYVDFGIFDKNNFDLLLLIEINGDNHNLDEQKEKDKKKELICNCAGYKLIRFWLNKPNDYIWVKNRLHELLNIKNVE